MRVVLLDPQWRRQSEIVLKRARQEASSLAEDIGDNISEFVKKRLELFGDVQEQIDIEEKSRSSSLSSSATAAGTIGPSLPPEKKQKQ